MIFLVEAQVPPRPSPAKPSSQDWYCESQGIASDRIQVLKTQTTSDDQDMSNKHLDCNNHDENKKKLSNYV